MATNNKQRLTTMAPGNKELLSTRNLGKNQLGGVIFGANNTAAIKECLSKQLFGLTNQHLVYVEKIDPGLPLFLFNYTDTTLHGIFEAATHGEKNIDLYAWTSDGTQRTPYPAQVQVRVRMRCQPLTENQFKPIIVDNYYTQNHFWFELDHAQTNKLMSLFSSQPAFVPHCPTAQWSVRVPSISNFDEKVQTELNKKGSLHDRLATIGKDDKELVYAKPTDMVLNSKFVNSSTGCDDETEKVDEGTLDPHKKMDPPPDNHEDEAKEDGLANPFESPVIAELIEKVNDLMAFKAEQDRRIGYMENKVISLEQNLAEAENEIRNLKGHCIMLDNIVSPSEESDSIKEKTADSVIHLDNSSQTSDFCLNCDDLIFLVGGYDGKSWFSSMDCYSPSLNQTKSLKPMNTARCYAPVSILKDELYVFGGGTGGVWYDTVESYDPVKNDWTIRPPLNAKKGSLAGATLNDKIYAVGGGSGNEYYSAVEMLDLDVGAWIPSRSMLQKRFSLAAAELNGALYAVGGYDGKNYLKSAERFDPREHSWTKIESMNTMRGCPCLVVLNEKLYVLGGFDGNTMIPSVEIYDPRRGSWVMGEPMNHPRGFSAAAVVKESIYIFGGLKSGEEINHTVECFMEGQGWETTDAKAGGQRCFFSAVSL